MSDQHESGTLMIIDDEPENLHLLEEMLRQNMFKVLAFPNGRLALKALERSLPDLILLDILMPEMDGYEVCKRIKAEPRWREIPVIFLSVLTETVDKVQGLNLGAVDYITKPFKLEEVKARVETHIKMSRLQKELQEKYLRLVELERLRDNLVHLIVHDMRSPMQVILGYTQLILLKKESLSEKLVKALQSIEGHALILTEMATDLEEVSLMEEGRMTFKKTPVSINTLVREAVANLSPICSGRNLTIDIPEQDILVSCDPQVLSRIVVNLMTNTFKVVPQVAEVRLIVSSCEGRVRIEIKDTGPGISPECKDFIFEKFSWVETQGGQKKYSAGLALNFCKLAVEAHDGSIGMISEIGKGSTFWFELPIIDYQPCEARQESVGECTALEAR